MKKRITFVLTLLITLTFPLAPATSAENIHLKYAELDVAENLMTVNARHFAKRVNELSDGRIIIDIYDNAQLGAEKEAVQATQMGIIDICRAKCPLLADFNMPMLNILGLPYVFRESRSLLAGA